MKNGTKKAVEMYKNHEVNTPEQIVEFAKILGIDFEERKLSSANRGILMSKGFITRLKHQALEKLKENIISILSGGGHLYVGMILNGEEIITLRRNGFTVLTGEGRKISSYNPIYHLIIE